jgi:hypothetical protein
MGRAASIGVRTVTVTIYLNPGCSKSRQALALLE